MKTEIDKIEAFRKAMNVLTLLHCNVKEHYDREKAEAFLHELMEKWHKDEDYVVQAIVQQALDDVNARSRYIVGQLAGKLGLPTDWDDFKAYWDGLDKDGRNALVERAVALHSEATA